MTGTGNLVVVVGGDPLSADLARAEVPAGSVVIAADSGLDAAVAAGLVVHHVVGDFDSVSPDLLALAERMGVKVHRHPADKDATDSELAIRLALDLLGPIAPEVGRGPIAAPGRPTMLVIGGGGGRLDHLLADLLALASPLLAHVEVSACFGPARVTVVRPEQERVVRGRVGEQLSLLPMHGRARGVSTAGLRWPLARADLVAGTTRAVSNEMLATEARVSVEEGVLLVVQPGTLAQLISERSTAYDPSPIDPSPAPPGAG